MIRWRRTKHWIVARPRGGTRVAAAKDALEASSGVAQSTMRADNKKRAVITLRDGPDSHLIAKPAARPPIRTPSPQKTWNASEPSLMDDPAGWLAAQVDGGVEVKAYAPVTQFGMMTPSRGENQMSRRLITDIGGRLMALRQASRRLSAYSPEGRRADQSDGRMKQWENPGPTMV